MRVSKPAYYDKFKCLAGSCPDSCCKEWSVDVDSSSASYYRELPGTLGDRLRQALTDTEDGTIMAIEDGRCPMWRDDGLCRIHAELGEQALCRVCSQFPRLRHDYGSFAELGLELSCPEAARLILSDKGKEICCFDDGAPTEADCDEEALSILLETRRKALSLADEERPPEELLTLLLLYGYQAQEQLDGGEEEEFSSFDALKTASALAGSADIQGFLDFFKGLEILTEDWKQLLAAPHELKLPDETRQLVRYLIQRYWLQAVSDYDLACRVKFIVISCLLVGQLGDSFCRTAQLFSKEIENDADNVDAILDAAYEVRALADDHLLAMLRMGKGD